MNKLTGVIILALWLTGCAPQTLQQTATPGRAQAAVAMPDHFSAAAAQAVLAGGGNAVDAAVAAAFVLAVTYPEAGNIGGGGFMLLRLDGEEYFVDYRETGPAAAHRDMYLDANGDVIEDLSLVGHRAVGVPGTVAGLWAAHRRHGSLPWAQLLEPAVRLARDGFIVPAQLAERVREESDTFGDRTNFARHFDGMRAGQRFAQPDLAATLRRIGAAGRDGFYKGETAALLVADMQRGGGIISAADLAGYQPVWRTPLTSDWRGYRIVSAPLPSSGGFAVIQLLKMKEWLHAEFDGLAHNSAQYVHLIAEMEKRVFADRAEYLGDPAFIDVPIGQLIDADYIASRASEVDSRSISRLDSIEPGLESRHTTHFSIVDSNGNAVANTYTLNTWFGSGVVVEGAGFLLNNEMDDFSAKPGVPNFYGVVGESANAVQAGKRMLSSMSPTLLTRDGEVSMVLGSPGGSTIFTSVFQTIVNILDYQMTPGDAVSASRFHHQLLPPDLVTYSRCCPLPDETIKDLTDRGYDARPHAWEFGDVQVIWWDGSEYRAASDPRGRGDSRVTGN